MSKLFKMIKRIFETIGKVLHFGCRKVEEQIPVEDQIRMEREKMVRQLNSLKNSPQLAQAQGLAKTTDQELMRAQQKKKENNYRQRAITARDKGMTEVAVDLMQKMEEEDRAIERLKDKGREYKKAQESITTKMNLLEKKVAEADRMLQELQDRNRDAQERAAITDLMNRVNDISVGDDLNLREIEQRIRNTENEANGREVEFDRRTAGEMAMQEVDQQAALDRLRNL